MFKFELMDLYVLQQHIEQCNCHKTLATVSRLSLPCESFQRDYNLYQLTLILFLACLQDANYHIVCMQAHAHALPVPAGYFEAIRLASS